MKWIQYGTWEFIAAQARAGEYVLDVVEYEYGSGQQVSRDFGWRIFRADQMKGWYLAPGCTAVCSGFAATMEEAKECAVLECSRLVGEDE
jgi:hypothetical protein